MTYAEFIEAKRERRRTSTYIYALEDPFTDEIRYVGKSIRPLQRLTNHCNERKASHRTNWLRSVLVRGRHPRLLILETLSRSDDWQVAERRWIAHMKAAGVNLVNGTSGGDGVSDLPADVRARMSATWRGRKHRPESLEKMAAASRGRVHSAESRARMRRLMTGRTVTWGEKLRRAVSKLSDAQVVEIRKALADGVRVKDLAQRYGVHRCTITSIKMRQNYRWIPE